MQPSSLPPCGEREVVEVWIWTLTTESWLSANTNQDAASRGTSQCFHSLPNSYRPCGGGRGCGGVEAVVITWFGASGGKIDLPWGAVANKCRQEASPKGQILTLGASFLPKPQLRNSWGRVELQTTLAPCTANRVPPQLELQFLCGTMLDLFPLLDHLL